MNPTMSIDPSSAPIKPTEVSDIKPAVETPEVKIGNPEKTLELIKAKLREAQNPETKKPEEKREEESERDLSVPPKVLKQLGTLQGKLREAETKLKDFDSINADATVAREVKKLWAGNQDDKLAAIAKIAGKDGLDELANLVQMFYKIEQESGDNKNGDATSPETKKLLEVISNLEKKIDGLENAGKKKEADGLREEAEKAAKAADTYVKTFIDQHKTKFAVASREANVTEAIDLAQKAALRIVDREKLDIKTLTKEQAEAIYIEALTEVETEMRNNGGRYAFSEEPKRGFDPDKYRNFVRPVPPPTIKVKEPELSKNPKTRFEQIRERALEREANGVYRR